VLEGSPPILFGILTYFCLPSRPMEATFLSEEEKKRIHAELAREEQEKLKEREFSVLEVFRNGRVWYLIVAYFGMMIGRYTMSFWSPQIIKSLSSGYSNTVVGILITIPSLAALAGMILIARSSDRKLERKLHSALPATIGGGSSGNARGDTFCGACRCPSHLRGNWNLWIFATILGHAERISLWSRDGGRIRNDECNREPGRFRGAVSRGCHIAADRQLVLRTALCERVPADFFCTVPAASKTW
jgi:hypothetical protein